MSAIQIYQATTETMRQQLGFRKREFSFPESDSCNVAEIHLSERYPEEKYARNQKSDMIVRIMKGQVYLYTEQEEGVLLVKGDTVYIPKNVRYYWIPDMPSVFLVVSTPAWTPEQHETIGLKD